MKGHKVSVDRELCYGSAECVHRAPAVFEFVDGFGVVRPGHGEAGAAPEILEAAEKCPSQAITVTDIDTDTDASSSPDRP
ncbi:ferredoxin [Streptomyces afghaniensis]|uniref:ferredoxin n=1 Tax=Streptomyces afghaniensis TaxID=66865 RepID=UPI002785FAE0|nr:ferredoxin [Streptomyces afghaniensis]MDQ1017989.1 ferredoxin [Streptomyces afghaniensis]